MSEKTPASSPIPYPLSYRNDGLIAFHTEQSLVYTCGFRDVTLSLPPLIGIHDLEVFDFEFYSFDPAPETRKKQDSRVSVTILNMLGQFFDNPSRVLLYACDSTDGRGQERQMLFKRWRENIPGIQGEDITVQIGEFAAYGGMLTRKDMPHRDVLDRELRDKASDIIIEKFGQ